VQVVGAAGRRPLHGSWTATVSRIWRSRRRDYGLTLLKNLGGMTFAHQAGVHGRQSGAARSALADFDLDGRTDFATVARYEDVGVDLDAMSRAERGLLLGRWKRSLRVAARPRARDADAQTARSDQERDCRRWEWRAFSYDSLRLVVETVPDGIGVFVQGAQPA
jgi:hypothetical protein